MPEIRAIVGADPSFAAQLLRLANSPLFVGRPPCVSLDDALDRIGLRGLQELLLGAAEAEILVVPGDPGLGDRMQRRALAVAVCSEALAEQLGRDPSDAFTAGLLHDLGLPLALGLIHSHRRRLPLNFVASPELQRALADQIHTVLGEELGRAWRLPSVLVEVLGQHHDSESPAGVESLARLVTGARTITDFMEIEPEGQPIPEDCRALQSLGVSRLQAETVADVVFARLAGAERTP